MGMTNNLDVNAIKDVISAGGSASDVLRDVVRASYRRDEQMSLFNLSRLDTKNLQLAFSIMKYRRQPEWSDDLFYELYQFAIK